MSPLSSRLKPREHLEANKAFFFSFGFIMLAGWLNPARYPYSDQQVLLAIGTAFSLFCAGSLAVRGWKALRANYTVRSRYVLAFDAAAPEQRDDRWASYSEKQAAGLFDPTGRILGMDMDGNVLFEASARKVNYSAMIGGQGAGKTSTQVAASLILTPLSHRPGTEHRS